MNSFLLVGAVLSALAALAHVGIVVDYPWHCACATSLVTDCDFRLWGFANVSFS
jgi:hypothetical protein